MGNRAVISTSKDENSVAIYLHWSGGPESVLAFLETAKTRGFRSPDNDECYAMARLTGIIHEFFGVDCETSLGIGTVGTLDCDNFDNGVYQIGKNWEITDRWGKGHDGVKTKDQLQPSELKKYNQIIFDLERLRIAHNKEREID